MDDVSLKYKIELALAGMEDGPPSHQTPREHREMLRAHQDAWNSLSWTAEDSIPIIHGRCWELSGGILAQADGPIDGPSSITFRQLPSALRVIESREWRLNFDFAIRDFAIDSSFDLLVLVEMTEYVLYATQIL